MTPKYFKDIRKDLGLSQAQMAKALGLTDARSVRYYEAGERPVSKPIALLMELFHGDKNIYDCLKGK
jgi:transcriptional regulator with XRE-family HTH domain